MRDDDDNLLADYDLGAWEAPEPSAGLPDAVIARAKQPAGVAPVEEIKPERRRSRYAVGAAIAAVLVAGGAFAMWGMQRAPKDGRGEVVAKLAQVVDLDTSRAQLDPGAEMSWRREKHRITAAQQRGAASWTVGAEDTLVIDAGAMVASVEASGASLRVEVTMNLSDGRVIGASAVTAAIVAMVTVVVYEGHVKVTSKGQTVVVEPGSRIEIENPVLEAPPVAGMVEKDHTAPPPACDEVACVLNNYEGECCLKFKKTPKKQPTETAACDAGALVKRGDQQFSTGLYAAALATYESAFACKSDLIYAKKAALSACRSKNASKAKAWLGKLPATSRTPLVQVCVREGIDVDTTCDPDRLRDEGQDFLQTGADAAALEKFEQSIACRADPGVTRLAFMAACRAKDGPSARRIYPQLPTATTTGIVQICLRNGIALPARRSEKTSDK